MSDREAVPSFYFDVLQTLEEIGAPYMIIGGFAAAAYGSTRVTYDIDIVVDLKEAHIWRQPACHQRGTGSYAEGAAVARVSGSVSDSVAAWRGFRP